MSSKDIITIDGPSGAGKGTIARIVAKKLGYSYLDTGSMYRAAALVVRKSETDINDNCNIAELLQKTEINIVTDKDGQSEVYINGEPTGQALRTPDITNLASEIAKSGEVRKYLVEKQKAIAGKGKFVVEGRDMGTYVFPGAKYKFYLDATLEERARRRHSQLESQGIVTTVEKVKKELLARDRQDMERVESPLHPAPNAVIIDTTELTISEVVDLIISVVLKRQKA